MRILVTGASGHVGGAAARSLAASGHEVVAAVRDGLRVAGASRSVPFDLLDGNLAESLRGSVGRSDAIVHAAACIDPSLINADVSRANAGGTHLLLNVARDWGGVPFVYISGVAVIGQPTVHPITELHPTRPSTAYTASKLYGEQLVRLYGESGAQGVSLRVSSPVGPGMRARRIFSIFAETALRGAPITVSEPERKQDYVDVRDVAAAIETCIARKTEGLFNVASGRPVSNVDLARRMVATLNSASRIEVMPQEGDVTTWDVSIAAAEQAFGFQPRFTLEDSARDFARELIPAKAP